jgi:phosphohistidine phosphatase
MRLWIIRHAKSDWNSPGQADHDRPLNARGERDGPHMAQWLAAQPSPATWIWTSTAARARRTAAFVCQGFAAVSPTLIDMPALYLATPENVLDVLGGTPADVTSAAVIAHNPGLTELVNLLAGQAVIENLPTFGVAAFDFDLPWHELGTARALRPGTARLVSLMTPKRLPTTERGLVR